MYYSVDDSNDYYSTYNLERTLSRRFESIELVLIVGTGGVPFGLAERFDIRLADVVVGETTSLGRITTGSNTPNLEVKFSHKPTSWWIRQTIVRHRSLRLRLHGYGSTNLFNRSRDSPIGRTYDRPADHTDRLFPREIVHIGCARDCSRCEGAVTRPDRVTDLRLPRYGENDRSVTHYGDAFCLSGMQGENEIEAIYSKSKDTSTPTVFTRNAACLVDKFPCLVICGPYRRSLRHQRQGKLQA
jgi:hypothetical protein